MSSERVPIGAQIRRLDSVYNALGSPSAIRASEGKQMREWLQEIRRTLVFNEKFEDQIREAARGK